MTYVCELGTGQRVYLDNQGTQTLVTIATSGHGQQQQSGSGFQTGVWTSPPQVSQSPAGTVIKITSAQGEFFVRVQGNSVGMMGEMPSGLGFQQMQTASSSSSSSMPTMEPMQPMESMQPMKPMTMGNMQMNTNPMEMRMGDMEMRMGQPASASSASASSTSDSAAATRRFCSQCGTAVKESDRFCASCGHRLGS